MAARNFSDARVPRDGSIRPRSIAIDSLMQEEFRHSMVFRSGGSDELEHIPNRRRISKHLTHLAEQP